MELGIKEILLLIINEIAFSTLIFIWYVLYRFGVIATSPLFALLITLIQNLVILTILIKKKQINRTNILRFAFILFILKVLPLLYFFPNYLDFTIKDVFILIYMYLIYIIAIIIIIEIFDIDIKIDKIVYNDTIGDSYEKAHTTRIFDFTYDEIIRKIIG